MTGDEPFGDGPPLAVLYRVVTGEPQLGALHGPLRTLITDCLAKDPADRPTTGQLLDRIATHWNPPADFPSTSPWPHAVTTLIDAYATRATRSYTRQPGPAARRCRSRPGSCPRAELTQVRTARG
ncbi:hypothetical protein [Streptomyces sp. NBC_01506]|uniref:hypothetical protein n=1 Tax=Streptomyces sp. NBC_01506 TaxID=2903887 RepID=UPI003863FCF6